MSIRLEMLQVARLAPKTLSDSAALVADFYRRHQNADGGFADRAGESDLYYTVFGLDGLCALQTDGATVAARGYLERFGDGEGLDFVHLCALARCWAALSSGKQGFALPPQIRDGLPPRLERFRSRDGGYHVIEDSEFGSAYGAFLITAAYQDLRVELPEPLRLVQSLKFLETSDGAWANERGISIGATSATAAAITLLRQLDMPIHPRTADWLWAQQHPQGGFIAAPGVLLPDLLSTATALHALSGMSRDLMPLREACLDFIDSLWSNEGGFHGHWEDDTLDCEYTYYGLLALGHLSV